ncbi:hypothetical protein BH739_15900 [Enterococcus casseliflavus]|nr:hypothetical protein BH739_15900 [Enterococcus casseliflavus]
MNKSLFLDNWKFAERPLSENFDLDKAISEESLFQPVEMPHDWLITKSKALFRASEGWYKKNFQVSEVESHVYYLEFDGIYMDSEIYLNGQKVHEWKYGYTPIFFKIDHLNEGENSLFVRVKHNPPNSRWYSGAGIYRNVWLHKLPKCYIHPNETYVHHEKNKGGENEWQVTIQHELANHTESDQTFKLSTLIEDSNGQLFSEKEEVVVKPGSQVYKKIYSITNPTLWSPNSPHLYNLVTTFSNDETSQEFEQKIGFRDIEYDIEKGMYLNGEHIKIQGVCQHHDLGALGSVANPVAIRRQLKILKNMGVNAIRTAHNPYSKEFYQLADEMGFLVQSEFSDIWKHPKNANDYSRFFEDWVDKDVAAWIKRERNHSCIFMWSIGNEIYDTHGREDGIETTNLLIKLVKIYDPLKNAIISFGSNYLLWENSQKAAGLLDAVGYNYAENIYDAHHKKYPNWLIYGSETLSVVQSRGVYHFPLSMTMLSDDDYQCSALGNSRTSWGAESVERCIIVDRDIPYSLGQFVWSGFDYIGEPTPYDTKNSYLGQIDTAGFPKDAYFTFQAAWTDYKDTPMIHVFPYWDFTDGKKIDVRVCSNAPWIELFVNGSSLGKVANDPKSGDKLLHDWRVTYETGELKAVAYDEDGKVIATDIQQSFGEVNQLIQIPDKTELQANGTDICFIEINGLDDSGTTVENGNNEIRIEINGPGRLLGLDNGDSTDYSEYKTNQKRMFNGKLLAMVGTTDEPGKIEVICRSSSVKDSVIQLESVPSEPVLGGNKYFTKIEETEKEGIVPIRKINLLSKFNTDGEIEVSATTLPDIAEEQPLFWRLTDEKGIDTDIGEWHTTDKKMIIKPIANGIATVRCGVKNGKQHLDLFSTVDLTFTGLKESKLNPYKPISGGLYTRSNVELTNGNERGVATLRDGESWVTFDDVDFGSQGSSELTMSLFPLEGNVFTIEIYDGFPEEGSAHKIADVEYTKGTIWNTYQEQTFKLPERIKGIRTLTFVFRQKVHIKEFFFSEGQRSFEQVSVTDNDSIYGDSFTISDYGIENIGNNVTITFNGFDFDKQSAKGIKLFGFAPESANSIQIKLSSESIEELYLLDVKKNSEAQIENLTFEHPISGKCDVSFVFLPGSNFNFEWFSFY